MSKWTVEDIEGRLLGWIWDAYRHHDEGPGDEPGKLIPTGNEQHKNAWNALSWCVKRIRELEQAIRTLHDRIESLAYTPPELRHEAEMQLLSLAERAKALVEAKGE